MNGTIRQEWDRMQNASLEDDVVAVARVLDTRPDLYKWIFIDLRKRRRRSEEWLRILDFSL